MDRRVLVVAAAAVLVAALVAVLAFSGSEAGNQPLAYNVEWPVEPGPSTTRSDELAEGRNETYTFELARANVTEVTVTLTWEDDTGEPDRFSLEVRPPNGTPATNASRNGTIELAFPLQTAPQQGSLEAQNRSQAREQADEQATDRGRGDWEVQVTLEDAPGRRPVPGAEDVETEPDGSNSYELTFAHEAFHAELGEARPPDRG
jgi:hypothetical protein